MNSGSSAFIGSGAQSAETEDGDAIIVTARRQNERLQDVPASVAVITADTIARTGIPPNYLDLEITESMLVGNPQNVIDTLDTLGQMGVTLTLDDFGTGYSSLSYLTRLRFHTIKIDRSFIQHIDEKPRRGIVQAIVAIAHSLGMRIIAEGVETPLQLSILREIGCEEIQGFYIAKPLDANAIESWWRMQLGNVGVMTL